MYRPVVGTRVLARVTGSGAPWSDFDIQHMCLGILFRVGIARQPARWLTARMDDTKGESEIQVTIEKDLIDVDGDGVADVEREVVTTVVDVDGDGVADVVQQTTTTAYDVDGDGVADIIESTTITGVDANRDGKFDADEVAIEDEVAVRRDLLDEGDAKS